MKWKVRILAGVVFVLLLVLGCLFTDLVSLGRENKLLREQVQLLKMNQKKQEDLYAVQVRLGEAYRQVLTRMVNDLGLEDRPRGAARLVLSAYEEATGIGGPE